MTPAPRAFIRLGRNPGFIDDDHLSRCRIYPIG